MQIKLTDLEPQFIRYEKREDGRQISHFVDNLAQAQGIMFLCPKCFEANHGRVGTHQVICWSRSKGVPDSVQPGPGRWTLLGTDYTNLTLGAEPNQSRSVLLTGKGCGWHGFVTNGLVT